MSKVSVSERNKKRKRIVAKHFDSREKLKALVSDGSLSFEEKQDAMLKLNKIGRDASPVRVNRRCTSCGRPKAVYRKFTLCRLCLRKYAMRGLLPGVLKASW